MSMTYKSGKDFKLYYTGLEFSFPWNRKGNYLGDMCESRQFIQNGNGNRMVAAIGESWKKKHGWKDLKHSAVQLE